MLPFYVGKKLHLSNNIAVTAYILPCLLYAGMDVR